MAAVRGEGRRLLCNIAFPGELLSWKGCFAPAEKTPNPRYGTCRKRRQTLPADDPCLHDSDAELVRRIRRGDNLAFGQLVDRHGRRLLGVALKMLGNAADAEDAVQETFVGAFRGLGGFQGRSSVRTWLTRILVRKVARFRRSQRLRRSRPIEQAVDDAGVVSAAHSRATVQADIRMDVTVVLAKLSEDHRDVIVLREMQGMNYEEMAEILGIPRGTVESRLFRARQKLRELLEDYIP